MDALENQKNCLQGMREKSPLSLRSVESLLDDKNLFYVPAYQRGYRWKSQDVKLLIEDLISFRREEDNKGKGKRCPFYSLQVVTLKKGSDGSMEVIDGQQRLTTVLIVLQTLYAIGRKEILEELLLNKMTGSLVSKSLYSIKYETRVDSSDWLAGITAAYFEDLKNHDSAASDRLREKNPDYYHFIDAFCTSFEILSKLTEDDRNTFAKTLRQDTMFIWHDMSEVPDYVQECEADMFNRLNATKISLNNAELIKALFLQDGNYLNIPASCALRQAGTFYDEMGNEDRIDILYERDQMAMDWDNVEKQLHDPSFWYFAYSSNHPYKYDTRIEYLFDLIMGKSADDRDDYYFTFNKYYTGFVAAEDNKLQFVRDSWRKVQEMFLLLQEWYQDKTCYHYIGYLLEYGRREDGGYINIPYLRKELAGLKKDERESKLKSFVKDSVKSIKSDQLIYGRREMTQMLYLFNVELERRRQNNVSRFSFSEYKTVRDEIGWDQEHVASNVDYEPKYEKRVELAGDLLEYFTGVEYSESSVYKEIIKKAFPQDCEAKQLCDKLLLFFNENIEESAMREVYDSILKYFDSVDRFREEIQYGDKFVSEKDFIWNFVLLNSKTNRSYGNSIFPVKRRRIQRDENEIYPPVGTGAVFEKAYSTKLTNMIAWGRTDAIAYWNTITGTLADFLSDGFGLPSYIKID